jgi:hypothetical protein
MSLGELMGRFRRLGICEAVNIIICTRSTFNVVNSKETCWLARLFFALTKA